MLTGHKILCCIGRTRFGTLPNKVRALSERRQQPI